MGVATGGWEPTARLKLAHVGIDAGRLGFASSSDARARTDIMRLAAQRAMQGRAFERATYFGDGAVGPPCERGARLRLHRGRQGRAASAAYADLRDTDAILAQLEVLNG